MRTDQVRRETNAKEKREKKARKYSPQKDKRTYPLSFLFVKEIQKKVKKGGGGNLVLLDVLLGHKAAACCCQFCRAKRHRTNLFNKSVGGPHTQPVNLRL